MKNWLIKLCGGYTQEDHHKIVMLGLWNKQKYLENLRDKALEGRVLKIIQADLTRTKSRILELENKEAGITVIKDCTIYNNPDTGVKVNDL